MIFLPNFMAGRREGRKKGRILPPICLMCQAQGFICSNIYSQRHNERASISLVRYARSPAPNVSYRSVTVPGWLGLCRPVHRSFSPFPVPVSIAMATKSNGSQSDDGVQYTKILLLGQQGSVSFLLIHSLFLILTSCPPEVVRPPSSNVFSTTCPRNRPSFSNLHLG